jgi:hypothetical protein
MHNDKYASYIRIIVKLIFSHEGKSLGWECVEKRVLRTIFMPIL